MSLILLIITLLQLPSAEWIPLEVFSSAASVDFSPFVSKDEVDSKYTITVLQDNLPRKIREIAAFNVEVVLKSGYTVSGVVTKWREIMVESPSGAATMPAVELDLTLEGWDHWDVEIFTVNVWCKLKQKEKKQA